MGSKALRYPLVVETSHNAVWSAHNHSKGLTLTRFKLMPFSRKDEIEHQYHVEKPILEPSSYPYRNVSLLLIY